MSGAPFVTSAEHDNIARAKRILIVSADGLNSGKIDFEGNTITKDWIDSALDEGRVFIINENSNLDVAETLLVSFLSGAITDLVFGFQANDGPATWEISSGGTPTGGSAITLFNPNIVLGTSPNGSALLDPSIAGDTVVTNGIIGGGTGGNAFGGQAGIPTRIIVPAATRINLEISSLANANDCTIALTILERTS